MPSTHQFDHSKVDGDWGERVFRWWLTQEHPEYKLGAVTLSVDKLGIDAVASFSCQVKTDFRAHQTGNAFIETVSVSSTGAPGWALKCDAAYLFYICPGLGVIWTLKPTVIAARVPQWEARYQTKEARNDGYVTRGVVVPLDEFKLYAESTYFSYLLLTKGLERIRQRSA